MFDYDDHDSENMIMLKIYHHHHDRHLTKGRSVKAPDMTLPMVFEIPITEIRKAAELSVTPRNNYKMRRSSIRLKKKHSFIYTDI